MLKSRGFLRGESVSVIPRFLTFISTLALAGSALATVVEYLDLPGLVERAQIIAEGRCLSVRSERDPQGGIVTVVDLMVERGFRGSLPGDRVVFRMPGGELDDRSLIIPGMPRFEPDDEVLLFLTGPSSRDIRVPVGLGQGRLRILRDPVTGAKRLERSIAGLSLVGANGAPVLADRSLPDLDYEDFVARLEALLEDER